MATGDQIKALVRAHKNNDHDGFKKFVLQIAASSETNSPKLAHELRQLAERPQVGQMVQLPAYTDGMLQQIDPDSRLRDMVLSDDTHALLERVVREHKERDKLETRGLEPSRKLLFVGPPGVGKTMAAGALAGELDLPLILVPLHGIIASFMGDTAKNMAKVFDAVRSRPGVYFFDEADALAGKRGREHDVPEIGRATNSLLQLIEQDRSPSLLLAATNLVELIDDAMFRRFDHVIKFQRPTWDEGKALMERELLWPDTVDWDSMERAYISTLPDWAKSGARFVSSPLHWTTGHADLVAACRLASKDAILADREEIETGDLMRYLEKRGARLAPLEVAA